MIFPALTAERAGKTEPDVPVVVVGVVPVAVGGAEVPGIVVEGTATNHTELFRPRGLWLQGLHVALEDHWADLTLDAWRTLFQWPRKSNILHGESCVDVGLISGIWL